MSVILFGKVCLYDPLKDETIIYGQQYTKFDNVMIDNVSSDVVFCKNLPDFYIKLKGKQDKVESIIFMDNRAKILEMKDIHLQYPFENCDLQINSTSAIISTLCKDYSHRLDEWIKYNLKLGFSGIVIFNNDGNKKSSLNESVSRSTKHATTEEICKKYKGRVFLVDMPYSPFEGEHWNNIQRITLHIGVNAFRKKCRNIALVDADEFLYLPKNKDMKIEDFLKDYSTITIRSNILTNKSDNDVLNNNVLQLAKYVGEDKYTKTILHTDKISENEFILTPHDHPSQQLMDKADIICYHCWMNDRYKYNEGMPYIDLSTFVATGGGRKRSRRVTKRKTKNTRRRR